MAEARGRSDWSHTSAILTLLANVHRDPKRRGRPYTPADFNPYTRRRARPITVERLTDEIMMIAESRKGRG
jgi:hypothetical protein